MNLSILYRGQLSSCNYGCTYCPFAKHFESADELNADQTGLARFVSWVRGRANNRIGVLFTPWGEALVRKWYQQAIIELSNMPHVTKVAIQTNLSCGLDWLDACDRMKLGIWATYHPSEVTQEKFLAKCQELERHGVRFSAGVVGLKEHAAQIESLRCQLPPHVYLWINAYKRDPDYYDRDTLEIMERIDPLFGINTQNHASLGHACRAGHTVITVDGNGDVRRCHFIKTVIGNIHDPEFDKVLKPTACTNQTCGCHIGYVHMPRLKLYESFGDGVLERIPVGWGGRNPSPRS